MSALTWHLGLGLLLTGVALAMTVSGWVPDDGYRETVPVTVRDNPASYKPSYILITSPSRRGTSSGGYSFGK